MDASELRARANAEADELGPVPLDPREREQWQEERRRYLPRCGSERPLAAPADQCVPVVVFGRDDGVRFVAIVEANGHRRTREISPGQIALQSPGPALHAVVCGDLAAVAKLDAVVGVQECVCCVLTTRWVDHHDGTSELSNLP
jgi:hypothetical protein